MSAQCSHTPMIKCRPRTCSAKNSPTNKARNGRWIRGVGESAAEFGDTCACNPPPLLENPTVTWKLDIFSEDSLHWPERDGERILKTAEKRGVSKTTLGRLHQGLSLSRTLRHVAQINMQQRIYRGVHLWIMYLPAFKRWPSLSRGRR